MRLIGWMGSIGAVLLGACQAPATPNTRYGGVDTVALRERVDQEAHGPVSVMSPQQITMFGPIKAVVAFDLVDSLGYRMVILAVDSSGREHQLLETEWEEGGCGAIGHSLDGARDVEVGGRRLLAIEVGTHRDGCYDFSFLEETAVKVLDIDHEFRQVLQFEGTQLHYGDPRTEQVAGRGRWPERLDGTYVGYGANTCVRVCEELMVTAFKGGAAGGIRVRGYRWNSDSTALILSRDG